MEIKDNVLTKEQLKAIQDTYLNDQGVPMYYVGSVATLEDNKLGNYYHVHNIYEYPLGWLSNTHKVIFPILKYLNTKALIKIKVNFYPRTDKIITHAPHSDQPFKCKSALFFVNSNDGFTYLVKEKEKVKSIENRVLHFDSFYKHNSSTCTNENLRCTINFNYF